MYGTTHCHGGVKVLSIRLLCIGKLGEKFWIQAAQEYQKRLSGYCKIEVLEIPETRLPKTASKKEIQAALEKEACQIRDKCYPHAPLWALCIEGEQMNSASLASRIATLTVQGISKLTILIGGSCGIADSMKRQASLRLSMSPMTFPHTMARIMLLEQLYRAMNILGGGKYHK